MTSLSSFDPSRSLSTFDSGIDSRVMEPDPENYNFLELCIYRRDLLGGRICIIFKNALDPRNFIIDPVQYINDEMLAAAIITGSVLIFGGIYELISFMYNN